MSAITSSRSASGRFRQRAALLAIWEVDTSVLHYTLFGGTTGTSPWTYVSVPYYNPDASQHVMLAVYDWGSSGTVDVDQLALTWGGL
jgi:hypothetical protein